MTGAATATASERGPNTTRVLGVLGFFRRRSFAGLRRVLRSGPSGPSSGPSPGLRRVSRPSGSVGVLGGSFEFFSGSLAGPSPGPSPGLASVVPGRVLGRSSASLRRVFLASSGRVRGVLGSGPSGPSPGPSPGLASVVPGRVLGRSSASLRPVFRRGSLGVPRRPSASLGVPRRSLAGLSSVFRRSFSASRVFPRGLQGRALC